MVLGKKWHDTFERVLEGLCKTVGRLRRISSAKTMLGSATLLWTISQIKVKLILSMMQVIALLGGTLQLRWPAAYEEVTDDVGAVANLSPLRLITLRCLAPSWNWYNY